MIKHAFSFDGKDWNNGLYETRNNAIMMAVNSYKQAVLIDHPDLASEKITFYLAEAILEDIPEIDPQIVIQAMRDKLAQTFGEAAAQNWFTSEAAQKTFGKKINEVSKLVVHELGQTPKMFSVQNVEEYTHDGQLVCTLDDLRPVLLALSDKDAVPLGMSKEESLARWQTLRNQLDGILKEIAESMPINGYAAATTMTGWKPTDFKPDDWQVMEILIWSYFTELVMMQNHIIDLQKELAEHNKTT